MTAMVIAAAPAAAQAPAQSPRRVALVIGNDSYQSLTRLSNPRLDAGRLAAILDANSFDVIRCDGQRLGCFDLTRADLLDALDKLKRKARGADLAFVFYAGHGMQPPRTRDNSELPSNLLAPIDLEVDCTDMSMSRGVALEELFKALAGARQRIVVIDACRNNPLAQCPTRGFVPVSFG